VKDLISYVALSAMTACTHNMLLASKHSGHSDAEREGGEGGANALGSILSTNFFEAWLESAGTLESRTSAVKTSRMTNRKDTMQRAAVGPKLLFSADINRRNGMVTSM